MDFLTRLFGSDLFASVAIVVVPWAVGRAFAWWKKEARRRKDERCARAVEALEIGVHEAWEKLGRAWKHAREDGNPAAGPQAGGKLSKLTKLSDDERERLRECAVEVAREVGREEGLDVLKIVGARAVGALIRKIIARRKLD